MWRGLPLKEQTWSCWESGGRWARAERRLQLRLQELLAGLASCDFQACNDWEGTGSAGQHPLPQAPSCSRFLSGQLGSDHKGKCSCLTLIRLSTQGKSEEILRRAAHREPEIPSWAQAYIYFVSWMTYLTLPSASISQSGKLSHFYPFCKRKKGILAVCF